MTRISWVLAIVLVVGGLARAAEDNPAPPQYRELVPPLVEALKDPDGEVRQAAAGALLQIGAEAVGPLVEALKDGKKDKALRANAAYLLGHLGPPAREALPALAGALKDDNPEVRRRAAFAIGSVVRSSSDAAAPFPPGGMGMAMMGGMPPGGGMPMGGGMAGGGYPGMGRAPRPAAPRVPLPDPGILMPTKGQVQMK
jgi:hypothetical protein